jgi:hypothetical protein
MRALLTLYGTYVFGVPLNVATYFLLLVGCWIYAMLRGGAPERIGVTILLIASLVTGAVAWGPRDLFATVASDVLLIDVVTSAAYVLLALRAERFWPFWVAAMQILTAMGHLVKLADPAMPRSAYQFMVVFWSYPMILFMVIGTWRHRRRTFHYGHDEAWSPIERLDR